MSSLRDWAAITTPAIVQIVNSSSTQEVMNERIENLLRDASADLARQIAADRGDPNA